MIATASDGRVRLRTAQPAEAIAALTREGATVAATGRTKSQSKPCPPNA